MKPHSADTMQRSISNGQKVLAAMSGGVDSSVTALLLKKSGFDVRGVMMKLYENEDIGEDITKSCCSLADAGDAERAAEVIGIPFYVLNYAEAFRKHVMETFIEDYRSGRTPNPCIECNRFLKFGALFERAEKMKCEYIATGHYAVIKEEPSGSYGLYKGIDSSKDQSYALYFLNQTMLSKIFFPLGNYTKNEVRAFASENGLENSNKPDSQDICFVPYGDYRAFLDQYLGEPAPPGVFITPEGKTIGVNRGVRNYTIGQRRGLGVSGANRLYVSAINPEAGTVTLGNERELYSDTLKARRINLIAAARLDAPVKCEAKIRYSAQPVPATAIQTGEDELEVRFSAPVRAITPGQAVVLYDGSAVIGGGTII